MSSDRIVAQPSPATHGDDEALSAVIRAQAEWQKTRDAADSARRRAVAAAIDSGVPVSAIAAALGLSRQRVYQIRRGIR